MLNMVQMGIGVSPTIWYCVIAQHPACLYYAEFGIMNSELSKLTIKKDVQKNVSVSFDNCIESNRGCLWGNQMSPVTHKTKKKS